MAKKARVAGPEHEEDSETIIGDEEEEEEEDYEERKTITFTVARILKDQQEMNFNFELSTSLNGRMFGSWCGLVRNHCLYVLNMLSIGFHCGL